jgi:hypothetical protein
MDNSAERAEFLCPGCEHGHYLRVVKNEQGVPCVIQYTCGPFEGPGGPGGWDGKTCPNFIAGKKKGPLEGCVIRVSGGEPIAFRADRR